MRYRLFGQTGLRVSEILLGTMVFGDQAEARRIIDAYADAGGNVLDTASAYGDGEALLGEILTRRDRFVLGTKYTLSRDHDDPNAAGNHRKNLTRSLEQSLRRLRTDYLDIYWVHLWDRHTPLEETMRALDDAVRAGKILYTGVSDAPAWVVARANTLAEWRGQTPFAGLQVPYNLLRRDIERELLPMAEAFGMSVTAWAPLASGKLTATAESNRVDPATLTPRELAAAEAVRTVAEDLGARPAQVALAWLRSRSKAVLPLVGVSSLAQLTENLAALDLVLPQDALDRLESAAPFELGFPGDFIAECEPAPFCFGNAATRLDGR
ncbi:aldo/keto reductase [Crossiella cryophila]|uniref:Aryl-alcohol dehydrogenase-like predicted oxidoreductase n=1 Tax=Crossiella cryophila TaxID=43355 RepID=A0A7W7FZ98_9PSEU|nr:aldo/keto reductase [Crossiella cryophila]MBB4680934.1 aryl-alcohol dehydrogenase-like predicted oxidoreductase [Crossiella cryophila]